MSSSLVARRGRLARARRIAAGLLLIPGASGCYTNVPVWQGTPAPLSDLTVGISDRGRTMLASQLGPGVRVVRGRLARATDSVLVIRVTEIEYLGNASTMGAWSGEEVSVPTDFISGITERRYSRGRTWLVIGVATLALALTTTIALNGFGTDPPNTKTGGGTQTQ